MPAKPQIIADPLTNRGTAFTVEERRRLGLLGRLPSAVETLDQQAARAYKQVCRLDDDLDKYIYLEQLHDRNEVLYYKVIIDHLAEMLPIVYDPTIGEAIKKWSADYRRSRAIYLSVDRIEDVRPTFEGLGLGPDDVDLLVVSDAEQILGIGDWGVNGTDISVASSPSTQPQPVLTPLASSRSTSTLAPTTRSCSTIPITWVIAMHACAENDTTPSLMNT